MRRAVLVVAILAGAAILAAAFLNVFAAMSPVPVYPAGQVEAGLRRAPARWQGRTIRVRGVFTYPGMSMAGGYSCTIFGGHLGEPGSPARPDPGGWIVALGVGDDPPAWLRDLPLLGHFFERPQYHLKVSDEALAGTFTLRLNSPADPPYHLCSGDYRGQVGGTQSVGWILDDVLIEA